MKNKIIVKVLSFFITCVFLLSFSVHPFAEDMTDFGRINKDIQEQYKEDAQEMYDDKSILIVMSNNESSLYQKNDNSNIYNEMAVDKIISDCGYSEFVVSVDEIYSGCSKEYPNNSLASDFAIESHQTILKIDLNEDGRDNIDNIISELEKSSIIESAERDYIIQMDLEEFEGKIIDSNSNVYNENSAISVNNNAFNSVISVHPNDIKYDDLYGLDMIMASRAWTITKGNNDVLIGVIDSGINNLHVDLSSQVNVDLSKNFFNSTSPMVDFAGHGTRVAGIIGAEANNDVGVTGVCWNANMVSLKCFNIFGKANISSIIEAFEYAESHNIKILNCSFGVILSETDNKDEFNAFQTAVECFTGVIIAAAGNKSSDVKEYPAGFDSINVISVGASDQNDNLANFSNYGDWVSIAAPGNEIDSTYLLSIDDDSGTSYSVPYVSGTAALIWSVNPSLNWYQVKNYILNNSDIIIQLNNSVVNNRRLNCFHAVRAAAGYIMGDIDCSGIVTAADARLVLRFSSQQESFSDLQKILADVNYDDFVTAADSRIVLQMASGTS